MPKHRPLNHPPPSQKTNKRCHPNATTMTSSASPKMPQLPSSKKLTASWPLNITLTKTLTTTRLRKSSKSSAKPMKPSATKTSVLPTIVTDTQPLKMVAVADLVAAVASTTPQISSPRFSAEHSAAVVVALKISSAVAADVVIPPVDSPVAISATTLR